MTLYLNMVLVLARMVKGISDFMVFHKYLMHFPNIHLARVDFQSMSKEQIPEKNKIKLKKQNLTKYVLELCHRVLHQSITEQNAKRRAMPAIITAKPIISRPSIMINQHPHEISTATGEMTIIHAERERKPQNTPS